MSQSKQKILLQLDGDQNASSFDSVVAIDSGIDHLLTYSSVDESNVEGLVHGAIFTRGPQDLHSTAIFIGGSNVLAGEALMRKVTSSFFGPMRVSVMMDANGSNTTAVAAVLASGRHVDYEQTNALILGATGPVGQRIARLLAGNGASACVTSRTIEKAEAVCEQLQQDQAGQLRALSIGDQDGLRRELEQVNVVFAAGAAGVQLLSESEWANCKQLKVAVDLNAVPPAGIEGIDVMDKAVERNGVVCYGPIGVGGTKMKIHKASLRKLFESNDLILDAEAIFELGRSLTE